MLPMLLFSLWGFGQSIKVQGAVTDEGGSPIPGVSVVIKGTTVGIVTNTDGKYQIEANGKSTLSFSFVGYKTQDIPVSGKNEINVKLVPSNLQVDEVIVVGYGTQTVSYTHLTLPTNREV